MRGLQELQHVSDPDTVARPLTRLSQDLAGVLPDYPAVQLVAGDHLVHPAEPSSLLRGEGDGCYRYLVDDSRHGCQLIHPRTISAPSCAPRRRPRTGATWHPTFGRTGPEGSGGVVQCG